MFQLTFTSTTASAWQATHKRLVTRSQALGKRLTKRLDRQPTSQIGACDKQKHTLKTNTN
uniref:Uncharacterized protein n=1 Tax=Romanomermis culicivorax TaxID=13658 RepID=A0A915HQE8_ROMCU